MSYCTLFFELMSRLWKLFADIAGFDIEQLHAQSAELLHRLASLFADVDQDEAEFGLHKILTVAADLLDVKPGKILLL